MEQHLAAYRDLEYVAGVDDAGIHPGLEATKIGDEVFPRDREQERVQPFVVAREPESGRRGYHDGRGDSHRRLQVPPMRLDRKPGRAALEKLEVLTRVHPK